MDNSLDSDGIIKAAPYRFTIQDARNTCRDAIALLDGFPSPTRPCQAERRARIDAALLGFDVHADDRVVESTFAQVWPELDGARADLVACELVPPTATGTADHLATSRGGVPKAPVDSIEIGYGGVVGDVQANRQHHGRPWQGVCLWSAEVLDALAARGHPVTPGGTGENVLVAGIDWDDVTPGVRLLVGDALLEVTCYAAPCRNIAFNFTDGDFNTISADHPDPAIGSGSRVYAIVRVPGSVTLGDPVALEPDA